jgi:ketosteroid isomerase-like protein
VMASSPNVDLVRSIYADWEHGDWNSADWAHPGIELVVADGPSPTSWTGLSEMANGWRDWLSAWEGYRVEAEEYRELDCRRVLVLTRRSGRGKTSGLELAETQGANVFQVHDCKVTKLVAYWDRDRANARSRSR